MRTLARLFAFLCGLYVTAACAAYQPGAVVQIPTVAALQGGNFTNTPYINLANYATPGDGGGGTFVPCTSGPCTVDNGVVFQDAAGNKFLRQFTGAVQLPWYGVKDATLGACLVSATISTCDAYPAFVAAQTASETYGNKVVTTAGRSVVMWTGAPSLDQNVSLDCGAYQGGAYKQTGGAGAKIYNLPNSIVLNPAFTINVSDNSEFSRCIIRPTWYLAGTYATFAIPPTGVRDLVGIEQAFAGTAILCGGEACDVHDLSIIGFDVAVEATGPRAKVCDVLSEDNIEIWVSNQRGGMQICRLDNPTTYLTNHYSFANVDYPVTAAANSGGAIKLTLDPSGVAGGMQIQAGDTVLIGGMQYAFAGSMTGIAFGDVCNTGSGCTPNTITNVNVTGASARTPFPGMVVTDTAGFLPPNTTITSWTPDSDDDPNEGTMVVNNNATGIKSGDKLFLTDTSTAPPGARGAQIVASVSGNDITLKGPLWTGPTKTNSSWVSGYTVISAKDSIDIAPVGQYLCNSGTAPFSCTLPTGWAQGSATGSNLAALGTGIGNLTIAGSLTGWPSQGVLQVDSEVMSYTVVNATTLSITVRGLRCSSVTSHTNGTSLIPAAPMVTFIDRQDAQVVMNVAAQSSSTGTTKFANDPTVCGSIVGDVLLAPVYATYSATAGAGQNMGTALNSVASGSIGGVTLTLGGDAYWQYVYEGESVADLTSGHASLIPAGTYVDQTPTSGSIHLCVGGLLCSGTLPSTISSDLISFGGDNSCGYPGLIAGGTAQPWLGNCASAMAVLGQVNSKSVQGVRCFSNHNANHRNGLKLLGAPATSCTMNVLNSSGKADGYDYNKTAIWISGDQSQKTNLCNNRTTLILIDSTVGSTSDIALCATQIAGAVEIASGKIELSNLHPSGSDWDFPNVLVTGSNVTGVSLAGMQLQSYALTTDGPATDAKVACSADTVITTTLCSAAYQAFTPTGATTSTTLANFSDRALSMLDFGAVPDCTTDATAALGAAETAALAQGVHVIRFDTTAAGNCYLIGNHTVAQGIKYYCPGPIPAEPTSNDYRNYPQTIAMSGSTGLVFPANTGMSGCNLIKSNLTNSAPPTTFQDNYARSLALAGTGLTVTGDNVVVENGNIIGFNLGVVTRASRQATFQNLNVDAVTCFTFANQGGGGTHQGVNLECAPYATRFGSIAEPSYSVTGFADNGSGLLRATLSSACTGTGCPLTGYPVWMANADNLSTQSAIGAQTATVIDSTHIDFQGSTSAFITGGRTEPAVTVTAGSAVISGLTLALSQIHPTQSITGACIPAGATLVWTEAVSYGTAWIDSAHLPTCSSAPTETVTIADTAPPAAVSLAGASVNVGGSGYAVGDTVSPSTGTGTPAVFDVSAVDGSGAVTAIAFDAADGSQGAYTVLPSPLTNSPTTTSGSGTGLTLDLKVASLYASAVVRNGPAFNVNKIVDVRLTNIGELSHSKGISCGFNCRGLIAVNCSLHDENVLQDDTHIGIEFWSNADSNRMSMCDSYYFGAAIAAHSKAGTNIAPNVVANSHLGGSAGNSGLQNTLVDVACYDAANVPCPGTAQKSSLTLSGDTSQIAGSGMTIMGDSRSVNMVGNSFAATSIYCQNDTAGNTLTGSGNSLLSSTTCQSFGTSPSSNNVKIQPVTTSPLLLTVGNCGNTILSSGAGGTLPVTLPSTAPPGCELTFRPNTNAMTINPNGNTIATNLVSQSSTLTLAAESNGSLVLRYDPSTVRWRVSSCAPSTCTINNLLFGQNVAHGQVYMSCKGTCSGGTGQLQVCPYNGPGGLIIGGALYPIPACIYVDNSAFSAVTSALRYVYLFQTTQGVTVMADNGSGKTRLTINSTAGFNTGDPIICSNATGTTGINTATYDNNTTLIDATHIDITDVNWVATGTATCSWIGYAISAAAHVTDANGVEVQSGNAVRTLVGMVFIDASHNLNDTLALRHTASWFNRQPKKMLAALGANTATTTSTTFKTPTTTSVEASFLSWGPPGTPSLLPQPAVPWSITAGASATGLASTAQLGACFGTAALGTNAACGSTVETEIASETQAVATDVQSYNLNGQTVTLTEGRNFADIVMNVSTGTLTLAPSATFMSVYVQE